MPDNALKGESWYCLRKLRMRQKLFGNIAAVFFAIAIAAMADGLIAGMRAGSTRLEMLPGEQLAISGPAAVKNPLPSDVIARFTPEDCPLQFQLEGFFTGYWFGSGMWRGTVSAIGEPEHCICRLAVSFRGMPAKSTQHYEINIFENSTEMQQASLSILRSFTGLAPFALATGCAIVGMVLGILTYVHGRIYVKGLLLRGIASVYGTALDGVSFLCISAKESFVTGENFYPVFDEAGSKIGDARAIDWNKGKWRLAMRDASLPPVGSLVGTAAFISQKSCDN